jgi:hypothetical protein
VVDLPGTWDETYGAYLNLGQVVDSLHTCMLERSR